MPESDCQTEPMVPKVLWAQQRDLLLLSVVLSDVSTPLVQFSRNNIHFSANAGPEGNHYSVDMELFAQIDPEKSGYYVDGKAVELEVYKSSPGRIWPRLLKSPQRVEWLSRDSARWVEDNDYRRYHQKRSELDRYADENGEFSHNGRRRGFGERNRADFSSTLKDPKQWPALGEDPSQKKKLTASNISFWNAACNARVFVPGEKSSLHTLESCEISQPSSSGVSSTSQRSDSESSCTGPILETQCKLDHKLVEESEDLMQEPEMLIHNRHDAETQFELPARRNSYGSTAARKRGGKTKWIRLAPEECGLSLQERLRQKRREALAAREGASSASTRAPRGEPPIGERDRYSNWGSRAPPRSYGYSGTYYSHQNYHSRPYHSQGWHRSDSFSNGQSEPPSAQGSLPQQPKAFLRPKSQKFTRKMQGARSWDIKYDSEFATENGEEPFWDAETEDGSYYDHENASSMYPCYYDDGSRTPNDWQHGEFTYGPEGPMENSFFSMSSDGAFSDYDPYGYAMEEYYAGASDDGYNYTPMSEGELRDLLKTQIEYYFSRENLEKDFFLRRHMKEDGSVPLSLVASFQRVRSYSQNFFLILEAVGNSDQVELLDDFRVRCRNEPEIWPIKDDDIQSGAYYFAENEVPLDETANWVYYQEELLRNADQLPVKDEENESGHCEDDFEGLDEEEGEECEALSIDGSELSEELLHRKNRLATLTTNNRTMMTEEIGA